MSRALDISSLSKMSATLRALPTVLAQKIATKAAPVISQFANESFEASTDPYGVAWTPKADGSTATLVKTGNMKRFLYYVAIGTKLRVALGTRYAKYQIGKRPVFPRAGVLPSKYATALVQIAQSEAKAFVQQGGAS